MNVHCGFVANSGEKHDFWTTTDDVAVFLDVPGNNPDVKQKTSEIVLSAINQKGKSELLDVVQQIHDELSRYKKLISDSTYFAKALFVHQTDQGFEIARMGATAPLIRSHKGVEDVKVKGMALAFPTPDVRMYSAVATVPLDVQVIAYSDSLHYLQREGVDLRQAGLVKLFTEVVNDNILDVMKERLQSYDVPRGENGAIMVVTK